MIFLKFWVKNLRKKQAIDFPKLFMEFHWRIIFMVRSWNFGYSIDFCFCLTTPIPTYINIGILKPNVYSILYLHIYIFYMVGGGAQTRDGFEFGRPMLFWMHINPRPFRCNRLQQRNFIPRFNVRRVNGGIK